MAKIEDKIKKQYGLDLSEENIFKLYKIESPNLSSEELQKAINATRKRWTQGANGANDKIAERDRERLKKADQYEAVLNNPNMRKDAFRFYQSGDQAKKSTSTNNTDEFEIGFAKEYFKLVETSKKLKKADVDFFFEYYKDQRKNKKAIIEMLEKDFKMRGLGMKKDSQHETEDIEEEGKKKNQSNPLIMNLFQKATVLKIKKCIDLYDEILKNTKVTDKFPLLNEGLYNFLQINSCKNVEELKENFSEKSKVAYATRQEMGTDFVPLVDLFNILNDMTDYQDVVDNIDEFKLLLKYPSLTPYMYAFVEMKTSTLKKFEDVAQREYVFRDEVDFILNYYNPLYDNFGISSNGIAAIIRKAEKKAKQNEILNQIDEKLGRNKKRKLSFVAELLHFLVYWPIFILYFMFETTKQIFTQIHIIALPLFALIFIGENWLFSKYSVFPSLLVVKDIFSKERWYPFVEGFTDYEIHNGFDSFILTLVTLIFLLSFYSVVPFFVSQLVLRFSEGINKNFDWVGVERTFQKIFKDLRAKTEKQFLNQKNEFIKQKILAAVLNIVNVGIIVVFLLFLSISLNNLSDKLMAAEVSEQSETLEFTEENSEEIIMVIYGGRSNVRSGPAVDYEIIDSFDNGTEFVATGNQEQAVNGKIWYEIYLDEEKSLTGWASQAVIRYKE